jgi:hypothetical protein
MTLTKRSKKADELRQEELDNQPTTNKVPVAAAEVETSRKKEAREKRERSPSLAVRVENSEAEAEFKVESAAAKEDLEWGVRLESIPKGTEENLHNSKDRASRRNSSTLLQMEEKMQVMKAQMTLTL